MSPEEKLEAEKVKEECRQQYPNTWDAATKLFIKLMFVADDGSWSGSNAPAWRLYLQQIAYIAEALEKASSKNP